MQLTADEDLNYCPVSGNVSEKVSQLMISILLQRNFPKLNFCHGVNGNLKASIITFLLLVVRRLIFIIRVDAWTIEYICNPH